MTTRSLLTHSACCLVGIGLTAIVLKPDATTTGPVNSENPRTAPANRGTRNDPSQVAKHKQAAAQQLLRSIPDREKYSEREKWQKELSTDQIPTLLEALSVGIGPEGLDYSDKDLIEKSIKRWLTESPEECAAWINQLEPGGIKCHFLKTMLEELLKSDPERALAMSESYQAEDPLWKHGDLQYKHVKGKIDKAWKKPDVTAEEMLAVFSELPRGESSGGSNIDSYPENFDFQAFLDGIASWNEKDRKQPGTMPTDVLETWARRDPQAAAQWFLQTSEKNVSVPFQEWKNIARAVSATSEAAAYHQWTADLLGQVSEKQFDKIAGNIEPRDMLDVADAIEDHHLRDRTLQTMAGSQASKGPAQAIALYGEISTPEARLAAIKKDSSYYFRKWLEEKSITAADWRKLGLTEAQVRAVVQP